MTRHLRIGYEGAFYHVTSSGITLQAVTNAVRGIEKKLAEDKRLSREMRLIKKEMGE